MSRIGSLATALAGLVLGVLGPLAVLGTAGQASAAQPARVPQAAGACTGGHGVTVVVEPGSLGGSPQVSCDPAGGGRTAARIFADAGHDLTPVSSAPDFLCRIDGRPADAGCAQVPQADAYWSLWWSDGSTPWTYASLGFASLTVPDGGAVAFTWVDGSDDGTPETVLANGVGASASPSPASSDAAAQDAHDSQDADAADDADDGAGGLPGWVAPVVVVVLVGGAAGVALARRRRS